MEITSKLLFLCFFCLALSLLGGCGNRVSTETTPNVVPYTKDYGRNAILHCLEAVAFRSMNTDGNLVLQEVKSFISQGADVNAKGENGNTPLHLACNIEVAKLLVSNGANVHAKNNKGETPLHVAGGIEFVELLVSQGADVKAKDNEGRTPLHNWAYNSEIAELLMSQGADINAKDKDGKTPFHMAVLFSGIEGLRFLVSKGADVKAKDNEGRTPLDEAKMENRWFGSERAKVQMEIVEYLSGIE